MSDFITHWTTLALIKPLGVPIRGIRKLISKSTHFKSPSENIKSRLDSLEPLTKHIEDHNTELSISNKELEDLQKTISKGIDQVDEFSKVGEWNLTLEADYTNKLGELDESLKRKLEVLNAHGIRDVKETLVSERPKLTRKTQRDLDEVKSRLSNIEKYLIPQKQGDVIETAALDLNEVKRRLSNIECLILQKQGDEIEMSASGSNITETMPEPNDANGGEQVASLDEGVALGAVFNRLFEAVKKVKDKTEIFKPHLENLKFTLDSLQPVIKELARHDKVLELPKEEVENIRIEMEVGVELVHKCSKVRPWAFYKKYKYTDKLFGLDESLQRQLNILLEQVASKSRENLVLVRNLETAIENIGKSEIVQNQGLCAIPESPSHTVELDVTNKQGTRDLKETLVNIEVGIKGSTDVVQNQTEIKSSSALPEPPLSTVGLDVPNRQGTRDVNMSETLVLRNIEVPEPSLPTVRLDVPKMLRKSAENMSGAEELVAGAALGTPFSAVYKSVLGAELITGGVVGTTFSALYGKLMDLQDKSVGSLQGEVKSMVNSLKPLIEEIGELDMKLNLPSQEAEKLKKLIERIITDLDKVSSAPDPKLFHEMEGSLQRGLEVLNLEGVKDVKETRVSIRNIETLVKRIEENLVVQGWGAVPQTPSFTVGLDVPLKELKRKLLKDDDDDDRVSMLVLTAPGGCGKTTLAKMFCQDEQVKGKFNNNIFFVSVSHKPNSHVVHQLYQWKKTQLSAFQNEDIAFDWLQRFLKEYGQSPLLLVLDDVWPESKSLLQKCYGFKEPTMSNCKILVTSRFKFPRFGSQYYLGPLNDEDAMTLFRHSASLEDRSSSDLKDIPTEIVKLCKGRPLAIEVVGRSLREICEEPIEIWQERIDEWFGGSSIFDSEENVLDCLQSSVDVLDKEKDNIKECFIDLGSFPEDQRIPAAALIDMWAELYELVEDRMSITNLYKLTYRNLTNLVVTRKEKGQMDDYYSEHFVTQHDIIRELAIHQTNNEPIDQRKRLIIDIREDNLPKWWTEQEYQPIKARLVSISTDGEFSTNWPNMELPEAEVLVLNFQTENYAIPEFVEKMKKLKVLIVTNYGFAPAELSNFQLLGSLPNLKRIRLQGISIPSISKNVPIQLKSLQKMSLFMCKIGQPFSNCSIQIFDAWPNLVELNIDYCNDLVELPAKLFDLICLKKLSITHSHKLSALPEDIGKLVNLEVLRLRSCTDLVMLPGSIKNLIKLNFLDISDCFSIKELPEEIGELSSLRKLNMRQCLRLNELPVSLLYIEQLQEVVCDEDTKHLWDPFNPSTRNIRITVAKDNINLDWLPKVRF